MIYDKKICPDILSNHIWDFIGHEQILVSQCPMTDSYLQSGAEILYETLILSDINHIFEIKCSAKWLGHDWERILYMVKQI